MVEAAGGSKPPLVGGNSNFSRRNFPSAARFLLADEDPVALKAVLGAVLTEIVTVGRKRWASRLLTRLIRGLEAESGGSGALFRPYSSDFGGS